MSYEKAVNFVTDSINEVNLKNKRIIIIFKRK